MMIFKYRNAALNENALKRTSAYHDQTLERFDALRREQLNGSSGLYRLAQLHTVNIAGHRAIRIAFDRQIKYAPGVGSADGSICTHLPLFADPSSRDRVMENMKMGEW